MKIKLFVIVNILLVLISIIFLILSIVSTPKNNTYLEIALISTLLSNLINFFRSKKVLKDNETK